MKTYPLFWPYIPKQKILAELRDTLNSRYLGQGPKVAQFEQAFGKRFGYKYPVFLNSGTSALELAYHLIGIGHGDEVIVPVLNFTGGQNGLLRRGVKIVFADIERETLNLDSDDLSKKITEKTKAIVAVHLGGVPVNKRIFQIAKEHNIPVIVDLAQDMGPDAGTYGEYLVYSFQAIKPITTGDGGMLVLRNESEYHRAKKLRWFGIDRERTSRNTWQDREATYAIEEAGYKFQPTDIDASFGLAALPDLKKVLTHRALLAREYERGLQALGEATIIRGGSHWLMTILADRRDELGAYLVELGVEANLVHHRNDVYKIFGGERHHLPNMDWVESRYLCLPINTNIKRSDVRFICKKILEFYSTI